MAGIAAVLALGGCTAESLEGARPYAGPGSVIATGTDTGRDAGLLVNGEAAIVYDPDGCQNWIIDDGLEGYSSPRFDPATGKPVCDSKYPPGTVLGAYGSKKAGKQDLVSGPGRKTVVIRRD